MNESGKQWLEYGVGKRNLRFAKKDNYFCPNLFEVELDDYALTCDTDKGKQLDECVELIFDKITVYTWLAQLDESGVRVKGIAKTGAIPLEHWKDKTQRLYGLMKIYKERGWKCDENEDNVQSTASHQHGCLDWTNPWYDVKKCNMCFMIFPRGFGAYVDC